MILIAAKGIGRGRTDYAKVLVFRGHAMCIVVAVGVKVLTFVLLSLPCYKGTLLASFLFRPFALCHLSMQYDFENHLLA